MVEGTSPGDAPPPPPQRATPARKGARSVAGAGSPRPHRPHPGHTGRGTLAARSRGRAARGGTAPDTRRPSQWWKAPPPGTPFCHPHSKQRRPARAHAVGLVLGPHARTDRTRDTRVAEPRLHAREDGRPGEGQRLTPDAPRNGCSPPPPGTAPQHTRGTQPPQGMQAKGTVLGPHTHTPAPTARGWRTRTARPVGGQSGEGQRLTPDAPHNGGRHPPCGAMRGKCDNCSYSTTTLFVELIRTYTLMHGVVSRLCFASSHTLLHSKIKRIRTLRLGGKRKIDQSLSPSQVCYMSRHARGKDNEQRWPKRCVEPCREQVGNKPTPNNAR